MGCRWVGHTRLFPLRLFSDTRGSTGSRSSYLHIEPTVLIVLENKIKRILLLSNKRKVESTSEKEDHILMTCDGVNVKTRQGEGKTDER